MSKSQPGGRYRRFYSVTAGVLIASAVPTLSSSPDETPLPTSAAGESQIERAIAEQQAEQAAREQWLESSEARQQRADSRAAHDDLDGAQASDLFQRKFGSVIESLGGFTLPEARVTGFVDDYTALVAPTASAADAAIDFSHPGRAVEHALADLDGAQKSEHNQLVVSSLPLRAVDDTGKRAPVDLDLQRGGDGLQPVNPLVDLTLPLRLTDGIDVGRADQLSVSPMVDRDQAKALELGDQGALYPNTDPDTDLAVVPQQSGVDLLSQLRSPESPESQAFHLNLGNLGRGASLHELPGGDIEIADASGPLGLIRAPIAVDAQGASVPATMRADGASVVVEIPHRDRAVAYPILVDPVVETYDWQGGAQSAPGPWSSYHTSLFQTYSACQGSLFTCDGAGLYVYAPSTGGNYPAYSLGGWAWAVPHSSSSNPYATSAWISSASFSHVNFRTYYNNNAWPTLIAGLWSWRNGGSYSGLYSYYPQSPSWGVFNQTINVSAANQYAQQVNFQLHINNYDRPIPVKRSAYLGGASVTLDDPEVPTLTGPTNQTPTGWIDHGTVSFDVRGSDPGLGMKMFLTLRPNLTGGSDADFKLYPSISSPCTGGQQSSCPSEWTPTFTYDTAGLPEGVNQINVWGYDALGKQSAEKDVEVKVDRSSPTLSLGGPLTQAQGDLLDQASYNLTFSATDVPSQVQNSGVASIWVTVDGGAPTVLSQTCPQGQCATPFTLNTDQYIDGQHTISATAVDAAGNESSAQTISFEIDRQGDVYHAKEFSGDPGTGGELLTEEWARIGTQTARVEEPDLVTTREAAPCEDQDPTGPQCAIVRQRTRVDGSNGQNDVSYSVYEGTSPGDGRVDRPSQLLRLNQSTDTPVTTGPIDDVLVPWQIPPPTHGSQYGVLSTTETVESPTNLPDGSDGPDEVSDVTTKTWIDMATRLPLKVQATDDSDTVLEESFYTYHSRLQLSELPSDFFRVPAPAPADLGQEKSVELVGAEDVGPMQDAETGQTFTPLNLGDQPSIGGRDYCLATNQVIKLAEGASGDIEPPDPADDPNGEWQAEFGSDPSGPQTDVDALYDEVQSGDDCTPGEENVFTPPLQVFSNSPDSTEGVLWHDLYRDGAAAGQPDPQDASANGFNAAPKPRFASLMITDQIEAPPGAAVNVDFQGEPAVAYVIPIGQYRSSMLVQDDETQLTISGPSDLFVDPDGSQQFASFVEGEPPPYDLDPLLDMVESG